MKTKLLRKLRKTFIIQQRNREYRVVDTRYSSGNGFWVNDLSLAIEVRREYILEQARTYKKDKKTLTP